MNKAINVFIVKICFIILKNVHQNVVRNKVAFEKKNFESKEVAIIKGHCIYLYYFEKKKIKTVREKCYILFFECILILNRLDNYESN